MISPQMNAIIDQYHLSNSNSTYGYEAVADALADLFEKDYYHRLQPFNRAKRCFMTDVEDMLGVTTLLQEDKQRVINYIYASVIVPYLENRAR